MAKKQSIPFQADEYSYRVQYSPEDEAFIGLVDEFPGLSAFAATLEEAVKEIQTVVTEGLQLLNERGEQIPEPLTKRAYDGKLTLRITPSLHRRLAIEAVRRGVSLNEHVQEKLSAK